MSATNTHSQLGPHGFSDRYVEDVRLYLWKKWLLVHEKRMKPGEDSHGPININIRSAAYDFVADLCQRSAKEEGPLASSILY